MTEHAFNAAEIGLRLARALDAPHVRRWLVETMGEDDERVHKWDELCARFWRSAP